jgi:catecholate siderophore receptor
MRKLASDTLVDPAMGRTASIYIKAKVRAPSAGAALGLTSLMLGSTGASAQQNSVPLPAVTVDAPVVRKVASPKSTQSHMPVRAAAHPAVHHESRTPAQSVTGAPVPATQQANGNGAGAQAGSSYNPRESQITRLPTRVVDTPQSITVIPQQVIQDQHTSTLVETLHNVPGISFLGGEGGTQGDNINIHGYSARNDIYRDGIRDPGWYTRDTFSVEDVEVLKGPSSFAFGRGSTGGVVDMTSKLPKFTDFTTAEVAGYSSPGVRSTWDVNRTFGESAARIIFLGNDTDVADRPHVVTRRIGVAPSITTNFSSDTRATLSYIFQHDNNVPDYGIPLLPGSYFGTSFSQPAPVSKNTFYGTASDQEVVTAHIGTLKIEHDFNKDFKLTNETRYSNVDRFVSVRGTQVTTTNLYDTPVGGSPLTTLPTGYNLNNLYIANSNYFQNHTQNTLLTNQTDLTGHFHTGFLEHTADAGGARSGDSESIPLNLYWGVRSCRRRRPQRLSRRLR